MPSKIERSRPQTDFVRLINSPFGRLRDLLQGIEPGLPPIDMTIGEPRHSMPEFLGAALQEALAGYRKYPPQQGTPELLNAIGGWLSRRYPALQGVIDPAGHILPLNGTREGLLTAIFTAVDRKFDRSRLAVLMPNPFYQTYVAAALAANAEPVFLACEEANGFLPDLDAIPRDVLARTAAFYLASPSNPEGAVADPAYLAKAMTLAREHDFMLFLDECYSEIYLGEPPAGGLAVSHEQFGDFDNLVIFNSLSKRSNVPGLRSGFIAGEPDFMKNYFRFRNVAAPQMPLPVQHASAVLWAEESHVEASRVLYLEKFAMAREMLKGKFDYVESAGTFFIWSKMNHLGGGEAAAKTFWKGCGVKMLPGAYLAQADQSGRNPGEDYVRIALVDDLALTRDALHRLASF